MTPDYTNYDFVRPWLAVGGAPDAPEALAGRFQAVLDLRPEVPAELAERYRRLGIVYRPFPLRDGALPAGGVAVLDPVVAWVAEQHAAGERVLIHCQGGGSRAPFVAAYVLLRLEGGDAAALLRDLQRRRPAAAQMATVFRQVLLAAGA
ncbi:MAG: dual specificity protein phosphatase family protein [Chloroflexi bacterium]|nr:dual specificity protein phosphatase family protein [Chloroflexota bacterium]